MFNLNAGVLPGTKEPLVDPRSFKELFEPLTSLGGVNMYPSREFRPNNFAADVAIGYGLGWLESVYRGKTEPSSIPHLRRILVSLKCKSTKFYADPFFLTVLCV